MKFINAYDDPLLYDYENAVVCNDLKFWIDIISQYKPNSILEIGCGTGRVAKEILSNISEYYGVDISKEFLNYFKNTSSVKDLNLILGDACEYNFGRKFDCIILPANFISHIQDDIRLEQLLSNLKSHLNINGRIIVDYYNPQLRFLDMKIENTFCYKFYIQNNEIEVYESHDYNSLSQINGITRIYFCGKQKIKEIFLPMRVYFICELEYIFSKVGLKIENKFGDYDFSVVDEYCNQMLYVLKA
jgi:SAM-dependent methyltransferase